MREAAAASALHTIDPRVRASFPRIGIVKLVAVVEMTTKIATEITIGDPEIVRRTVIGTKTDERKLTRNAKREKRGNEKETRIVIENEIRMVIEQETKTEIGTGTGTGTVTVTVGIAGAVGTVKEIKIGTVIEIEIDVRKPTRSVISGELNEKSGNAGKRKRRKEKMSDKENEKSIEKKSEKNDVGRMKKREKKRMPCGRNAVDQKIPVPVQVPALPMRPTFRSIELICVKSTRNLSATYTVLGKKSTKEMIPVSIFANILPQARRDASKLRPKSPVPLTSLTCLSIWITPISPPCKWHTYEGQRTMQWQLLCCSNLTYAKFHQSKVRSLCGRG